MAAAWAWNALPASVGTDCVQATDSVTLISACIIIIIIIIIIFELNGLDLALSAFIHFISCYVVA